MSKVSSAFLSATFVIATVAMIAIPDVARATTVESCRPLNDLGVSDITHLQVFLTPVAGDDPAGSDIDVKLRLSEDGMTRASHGLAYRFAMTWDRIVTVEVSNVPVSAAEVSRASIRMLRQQSGLHEMYVQAIVADANGVETRGVGATACVRIP